MVEDGMCTSISCILEEHMLSCPSCDLEFLST
jgi:hypothetical protein